MGRFRREHATSTEMAVYFSSQIASPGAPTHAEWSLHRPKPDEPFSGAPLVAVAHADGSVGVYAGAWVSRRASRFSPNTKTNVALTARNARFVVSSRSTVSLTGTRNRSPQTPLATPRNRGWLAHGPAPPSRGPG